MYFADSHLFGTYTGHAIVHNEAVDSGVSWIPLYVNTVQSY